MSDPRGNPHEEDYSDLLASLKPPPTPPQGPAPRAVAPARGRSLWPAAGLLAVVGLCALGWAVFSGGKGEPTKLTGAGAALVVRQRIAGLRVDLQRYSLDCNRFPRDGEGLQALVSRPQGPDAPGSWRGPYAAPADLLDSWGHPFVYVGSEGAYRISSLGADNKPGGEGDSADFVYDSKDGEAGLLGM
ncbi:MAG TPA: type II secretion system protein GspG [Armatimonadota bacterium]|jgi:general secretion pathway protein G